MIVLMYYKERYLEVFSFILLLCSFFYFMFSIYNRKYFYSAPIVKHIDEYEKHKQILNKYHFEVTKISTINGVVCAVVKKDNIAKQAFLNKENYKVLERSDSDLVVFEEVIQETGFTAHYEAPAEFVMNAFCFMDENNWDIWIDGHNYTQNSCKISDEIFIKKVTADYVLISNHGNEVKILVD